VTWGEANESNKNKKSNSKELIKRVLKGWSPPFTAVFNILKVANVSLIPYLT
jgi:hypothetical protein